MPYEESKIKSSRQIGDNPPREYIITLLPDSTDRKKALECFEKSWHQITPDCQIPDYLHELQISEAQKILDANPIPRLYSMIHMYGDLVNDEMVNKLILFPELRHVVISGNAVTDAGVQALGSLTNLNNLCLYSSNISDACLNTIRQLKELRSLDLQRSCGVLHENIIELKKVMPKLTELYLPHPSS